MSRRLSRRDFLRLSTRGVGAAFAGGALGACSDGDGDARFEGEGDGDASSGAGGGAEDGSGGGTTATGARARFEHGVASGDPLADAVILWTRATPEDPSSTALALGWEVAADDDEGFAAPLASGTATTDATRDWTVRVDARGLAPGTRYRYRFRAGDALSRAGRTRTLPSGAVDAVRLAVVSCSNYPAGHFHVYAEIAERDDLDAVLHLGDYIYEDGMDGFATENAEAIGRVLAPGNDSEALSLVDYRARYATYRGDPDLQAAHASAPFIAVWDDHEFANNIWLAGAAGHDGDTEGDFATRRAAAARAWLEWMPVRIGLERDTNAAVDAPPVAIHRRFDFGELVSLYMLDARQAGRDDAVDRNDYLDRASGTLNMTEYTAALEDPNRSMLGDAQLAWLEGELAASAARWQVLGQQVLMGRMAVPAEMRVDVERRGSPANLVELVAIADRVAAGDATLGVEERARLATRIPYYQDGWDGYPAERERLFETARRLDLNLVALAGDTHNAWASDLESADGTAVGVELATTAVTSPGLSRLFGVEGAEAAAAVEAALLRLIDGVRHVNVLERGYLVATFSAAEASAEWHHVASVLERERAPAARGRRLAVRPGADGRRLLG